MPLTDSVASTPNVSIDDGWGEVGKKREAIAEHVQFPSGETVQSAPLLNLRNATREDILTYYLNTWNLFETLKHSLTKNQETYLAIPDRLRRPLIFYVAHTAALYMNKMVVAGIYTEEERINPHFCKLFATGVDEMSWDDMDDSHFDWPAWQETWVFRNQVKELVVKAIMTLPLPVYPGTWDTKWYSILMGFEHERIHLETSSVLMRQLPVEQLVRPKTWKYAPTSGKFVDNFLVDIPATTVHLGKPLDFPSYGWDNEYGAKTVEVPAFKVSRFKVTNGEFLKFVQEGGYTNRKYWDEEGWAWVTYVKARCPLFWIPVASRFKYRAMYDIIDMPFDWPVDCNFHEAMAYCRWKGPQYRIISEEEHWAMRDYQGMPHQQAAEAGRSVYECAEHPEHDAHEVAFAKEFPGNAQGNWGSSTPVDFYPPNSKGIFDIFGNVWEWTTTAYDGFPGFRTHPVYDDFSVPCFDSRHNMMIGGSWISTGDEISIYARYAFRRHFYQHVGFRLACDIGESPRLNVLTDLKAIARQVFESQKVLKEQCLSHFPPVSAVAAVQIDGANFPARLATLATELARSHGVATTSALELGCSVGRTTFDLTRAFSRVVGLDSSTQFVGAAQIMKDRGFVMYEAVEEGHVSTRCRASPAEDINRQSASFIVGDLAALPEEIGTFDVVVVSPLSLERLDDPAGSIENLAALVKQGGLCIIASTYSWIEDICSPEKWLGGRGSDRVVTTALDAMKASLQDKSGAFSFVESRDLPMLCKKNAREFTYAVVQVSVWKRS